MWEEVTLHCGLYTPHKQLCKLMPVCNTDEKNEMAKEDKGTCLYITVKELAKAHKVVYHS